MNRCLHCALTIKPGGRKQHYPCPVCGRLTAKITSNTLKLCEKLYAVGFSITCAEAFIVLEVEPNSMEACDVIYCNVTFDRCYSKAVFENPPIPNGWEYWSETDCLGVDYTGLSLHEVYPAQNITDGKRMLKAAIYELRRWCVILSESHSPDIFRLAGLL